MKMFGIKHNECVGFESRWKVTKVSAQSSSQTTEFSTSEKSANTETNSIEVQTEPQYHSSSNETDMEKLAEWLKKIYPSVNHEINDSNNTKAFQGYNLQNYTKEINCKLLQNFPISKTKQVTSKTGLQKRVSSLSWNCSGNILSVACSFDHRTWCEHSGSIYIFSFNRNREKLNETPKKKLDAKNCVTCVKFHPSQADILASGTYAGIIIIWNIQNEENLLILSQSAHEECVTQISWVLDLDQAKTLLLASSSTDGLLKLWNYDQAGSGLTLKVKYRIKVPIFGKTQRASSVSENISKKISRGILGFDFSKYVPDMFCVALEGGLVVQCSMLGTRQLKGSTNEEPIADPVFKHYTPHEGEINSINFSPNMKDMFMTNATDGEIRVYLIGQDDPAQVIFLQNPLNIVTWVQYEDKLIAGCGNNGLLEVFNVQKGKMIDNLIKEKIAKKVLSQISISNNLVAIGTENGDLQLWDVPWNLISFNHG